MPPPWKRQSVWRWKCSSSKNNKIWGCLTKERFRQIAQRKRKLSLRTSDRCHWCGNPPDFSSRYQEVSLLTGGFPRQCAHWLGMTVLLFVQFFFSETAPFQSVKEPRFMSGKTGFLYLGKENSKKKNGSLLLLCLLFVWVWCLLVSQPKKVVNTDMIELRQCNENLRRDHAFATLIISIGSLRNIDLLAKFSLREVRIFS